MHPSAYLCKVKHKKDKPGAIEIGYLPSISGNKVESLEKLGCGDGELTRLWASVLVEDIVLMIPVLIEKK